MKAIGIIPSRYGSTYFPGKPLALLGGKPVISWVYEKACSVLDDVYVATDDNKIAGCVQSFGGNVIMTGACQSGTDRCFEAYRRINRPCDVVVNIQGDEPFIHPSQLESIVTCFVDEKTQIATCAQLLTSSDSLETLENPRTTKVVLDKANFALYFSRSIIPYVRDFKRERWLTMHTFYKHIGLYAYRPQVLKEITALSPSSLETAESLEQLRWLENGYKIKVAVTRETTIGIDTPQDLQRAEAYLKRCQ